MTRPLRRLLSGVVCVVAFGVGLSGCSAYHEAHRRGDNAGLHPPQTPEFDLQFIEADDEGWFWEPAQATAALSFVKKAAATNDTIVVLFVHGWHHSACCCDDNVEGFKQVLRRLRTELAEPMYQDARSRVRGLSGPPPEINVVGIYLGWSGRSLPGWLDYTTFWGRKSAAKRVGENDFQEFMVRLQQVFNARKQKDPFLGLVSIGHSFGGEVLLTATSKFFESQLQQLNPVPAFMHNASAPAQPMPVAKALTGFGDMVILVNPAVEASAYQRINLLSRGLSYHPTQTPVLVTFSAENDRPRRGLFTAGRIAGEFFTASPRLDDERERRMERHALGVYGSDGEQVTHSLVPVDDTSRLQSDTKESTPEALCKDEGDKCRYEWHRWKNPPAKTAPDSLSTKVVSDRQIAEILGFDFSKPLVFANLRLAREQQAMDYQPMIVAKVNKQVIDGHSGMFSEPFMDFLIRYIGFIEAKKFLLNALESR